MEVKVFISYSHEDRAYLSDGELLGFLRGLEKDGVSFWWDEALAAGDNWDEEIKKRIEETHVALVLVSQRFLDSDYCANVEVEAFLKQSREKGLVIFPVILSPCEWQRHDWLKSRQFLPPADETVETDYADAGRRKALYHRIRQDLRRQVEKIRGPGGEPVPGDRLTQTKTQGAPGSFLRRNRIILAAIIAALAVALSVVGYRWFQRPAAAPACQLTAADEKRVKELADNIDNNLRGKAPTTARREMEEVRKLCASYPRLADWERAVEGLEKNQPN
jgi:hypothetical protein